ncbi:MAG TPA: hypothetical protein O0W81_04085 [Methanocorpusculum sp.]|nr:hypothetical protein [Methanocorpusculum sp.]HJK01209.1 hypothetical protein [Methanocorpusculum sp.]HJK02004.1 hypothetical protein [Methanocorpusculum sp.]
MQSSRIISSHTRLVAVAIRKITGAVGNISRRLLIFPILGPKLMPPQINTVGLIYCD